MVLPGGGVHFAFTWSVVPVVVAVIYDGAALVCSHCLWWVVYDKVSLLPTVPRGGVLCPCYDEFWGGSTCRGFP